MIKACIFDLDGTLLNTLPTISGLGNMALGEFGYEAIDPEEVKYMIGYGSKNLIQAMLERAGGDVDKEFDKVYKAFMKAYNKGVTEGTTPYDGIPELLSELKTRGISVCVFSNKPHIAAVESASLFFGDMIDIIYGAREGVSLKPSSEGLEMIFDELAIDADEALYIGDSEVDMQTGKNAKCFTIGVLWGFRKKDELVDSGADLIVQSPNEILDYVIKHNQ